MERLNWTAPNSAGLTSGGFDGCWKRTMAKWGWKQQRFHNFGVNSEEILCKTYKRGVDAECDRGHSTLGSDEEYPRNRKWVRMIWRKNNTHNITCISLYTNIAYIYIYIVYVCIYALWIFVYIYIYSVLYHTILYHIR